MDVLKNISDKLSRSTGLNCLAADCFVYEVLRTSFEAELLFRVRKQLKGSVWDLSVEQQS